MHYHFTEKEKILKEISEGAHPPTEHSLLRRAPDPYGCCNNRQPCAFAPGRDQAQRLRSLPRSVPPRGSALFRAPLWSVHRIAGPPDRPTSSRPSSPALPPPLAAGSQMAAAGKFLEHAEVHGNVYGTSFAALDAVKSQGKICILDIDVQARGGGLCLGRAAAGGRRAGGREGGGTARRVG